MENKSEIKPEIMDILNFLLKSDIEMYGYVTTETLEEFRFYGVEPPGQTGSNIEAGELNFRSPKTVDFRIDNSTKQDKT
jgi:hypothetical protein